MAEDFNPRELEGETVTVKEVNTMEDTPSTMVLELDGREIFVSGLRLTSSPYGDFIGYGLDIGYNR